MSITDPSSIRSFALVGHGGDGKTTLADSLVMAGGAVNRLGSVEERPPRCPTSLGHGGDRRGRLDLPRRHPTRPSVDM